MKLYKSEKCHCIIIYIKEIVFIRTNIKLNNIVENLIKSNWLAISSTGDIGSCIKNGINYKNDIELRHWKPWDLSVSTCYISTIRAVPTALKTASGTGECLKVLPMDPYGNLFGACLFFTKHCTMTKIPIGNA